MDNIRSSYDKPEDYFPEEYGYGIPDDGHWIMVRLVPPTEYRVPMLSMWYATRYESTMGHRKYGIPIKFAQIITPLGPLNLYPGEYIKVDIFKYMDFIGEDFKLCFMADTYEDLSLKLFYLRSRGIDKVDAYRFLLGEMKDPNLCFILPHPLYVDRFSYYEQDVAEAWIWWHENDKKNAISKKPA